MSLAGKLINGMAVTGAGRLPSKLIIHHTDNSTWSALLHSCLREAEKLKMASIALPLLGSGKKIEWSSLSS